MSSRFLCLKVSRMHVHRSVSINHTVGSWTMVPVSGWLLCSVTCVWLRESPGTFPGAAVCKVSGNHFRLKWKLHTHSISVKGLVSEFLTSPGNLPPITYTHSLVSFRNNVANAKGCAILEIGLSFPLGPFFCSLR